MVDCLSVRGGQERAVVVGLAACPAKGAVAGRGRQCGAMAGAARCVGRCSVLRWLVQRAAFVGRPSRQVPLCAVRREKGCRGVVRPACRPCRASQASLPVAPSCIVLCAMVFSPPCGGFLARKPHFAFPIALLCARFAARKRKLLYLCDRMRTHVHTHTQ